MRFLLMALAWFSPGPLALAIAQVALGVSDPQHLAMIFLVGWCLPPIFTLALHRARRRS